MFSKLNTLFDESVFICSPYHTLHAFSSLSFYIYKYMNSISKIYRISYCVCLNFSPLVCVCLCGFSKVIIITQLTGVCSCECVKQELFIHLVTFLFFFYYECVLFFGKNVLNPMILSCNLFSYLLFFFYIFNCSDTFLYTDHS